MFHPGAVNYLGEYLRQVGRKERQMTPSEKALVDRKNATVPATLLGTGLFYALPNHLAFKYILKDYPIYRVRHLFTFGMFLVGVGTGVKQAGSKFLLDFCSLGDSDAAREAREIVRRDNPQHPFLLSVEARMKATGQQQLLFDPTAGADPSSITTTTTSPLPPRTASRAVNNAPPPSSDFTDDFAPPPPAQPQSSRQPPAPSTPNYSYGGSATGSSSSKQSREFVGEDAFGTSAASSSAASSSFDWEGEPTTASSSSTPPPPAKRSWEDVQREFEQKRTGRA